MAMLDLGITTRATGSSCAVLWPPARLRRSRPTFLGADE